MSTEETQQQPVEVKMEEEKKDDEVKNDEKNASDEEEEDVEGKEEDLTDDGKLKKKIITKAPSSSWKTPTKNSDVTVHYTGRLLDGTVFDSSRDRNEPFTFKLGVGQVIKGWDKGVKTMKKGEKALFTIHPDLAYGASGSPPKIPPNSTLEFEVELIDWKDEIDVTKDGGIVKKLIKEGEGWETPKDDSEVTINYTLKVDGELKDMREGFKFIIGAEQVINGLEKTVEGMKKGESCTVKIKPNYGYGESGDSNLQIGPNAELEYEITLIDFTKEKGAWEMETNEKLEACEKAKAEGNELFKIKKWERAKKKYKKAVDFVDSDYSMSDEEKTKAKALKVPCYLNLAACEGQLKDWKAVITNCDKALEIEPNNVKGLFRKGQAYSELDEWDDAKKCLKKALELQPNDKLIKSELAKLQKKIVAQNNKDKKRFANIFERMSVAEAKENAERKKQEELAKKQQQENEKKEQRSGESSNTSTDENKKEEKMAVDNNNSASNEEKEQD